MGDHWNDRDFAELLDYPIVRPANLSGVRPIGVGHRIIESRGGRVLIINLLGFAFMRKPGTNYFDAADQILAEYESEKLDAVLVDFHAEATSEKNSMGYHLDGRVSVVVGTHTHIPTADARLLPEGTAYQTDVGMCGAVESVIGITPEGSKEFLLSEMGEPVKRGKKMTAENRPYACDAVLVETDGPRGAKSVIRLSTR
jgi:calcineurin-like phosphoesterase